MNPLLAHRNRLHGRAIHQKLKPRENHLISRLQSGLDGVGIPYRISESYRLLTGDEMSILIFCNIHECLSSNASHCQNGNRRCRGSTPDHLSTDLLIVSQTGRSVYFRFCKNAL